MMEESDLSLEVVILLIFGVFMLLFGLLLFKIHTGDLPYNLNSTYGIFLVMISFQIITMGKTPFGDLRRSWALILLGMFTAVLGMAACFIPGYFTKSIRLLIGIVLSAGGVTLLLQLCFSEKKARMWLKIAGILRQLTLACALVYVFLTILGIITLFDGLTSTPQTATILIFTGISFFYLSWCIWKVRRTYGPEKPDGSAVSPRSPARSGSKRRSGLFQEASLALTPAVLILFGILMTFLGLLLIPVSLGMLPFSPDGQLGLLLTIMATQIMALGDTPIGHYRRSWFMIIIGLIFAALGVVSCIVPGLLTGMLRIFLGLLNIMAGVIFFGQKILSKPHGTKTAPLPPLARKLARTQIVLNVVGLAFGISVLFPDLLSGLVVVGLVIVNGFLFIVLATLIQKLTSLQAAGEPRIV
jgi:hypothetical protein